MSLQKMSSQLSYKIHSAAAYNETQRIVTEGNENYSASLDTLSNTIKETLDNHHRDSQASSTVLIVYQVIEAVKSKPSTNQQSREINVDNQDEKTHLEFLLVVDDKVEIVKEKNFQGRGSNRGRRRGRPRY